MEGVALIIIKGMPKSCINTLKQRDNANLEKNEILRKKHTFRYYIY